MVSDIDKLLASGIINQLETGGFILTERQHKPHSFYSSHAHESTSLSIIYQGSFTEIISRKLQECALYSLQLLPAQEHHSYKFNDSDVRCLTIEIKPQRLEEISRFSKGFDRPVYFREGLSLPIKRLYKEFRGKDQASNLILEGILFEILGNVERYTTRSRLPVEPKWLHRAKDFIHENAARGVSLTSVAALVEVHPSYLARLFRKFYHCSIGDYVRKVRLESASLQLSNTNKSLSEIALDAGFYDQSHFTRDFKLYLKMTPGEFRVTTQPKKLR